MIEYTVADAANQWGLIAKRLKKRGQEVYIISSKDSDQVCVVKREGFFHNIYFKHQLIGQEIYTYNVGLKCLEQLSAK